MGLAEFFVRCPACESHQPADAMVVSHYYHFYFIPVFPVGKHVDLVCQHCGLKRYGTSFDSTIISNYDEVKTKYRHPWYTYTGTALLLMPIVVAILVSI
ncbi:MAG: hypothetical protein K0Q66_2235 [Chitinophagaceae bacterium]|nr:hypothetical protein [Chitinophagaceae bacterium]